MIQNKDSGKSVRELIMDQDIISDELLLEGLAILKKSLAEIL